MTFRRINSSSHALLPLMEPIHVLGGGSIGLLWAASIRAAFPSYPIALLLREHHRLKLDPRGSGNDNCNKWQATVCLMRQRRPRLVKVPAELIVSTAPTTTTTRARPIRNLIVATKAFAAVDAVRSVLDRLLQPIEVVPDARNHEASQFLIVNNTNNNQPPVRRIIILCNGALAVKEELQSLLAAQSQNQSSTPTPTVELVLATTTHGAYSITSANAAAPTSAITRTEDPPSESNHASIPELSRTHFHVDDRMYTIVHAGVGSTYLEGSHLKPLAKLWHMAGLISPSSSDDLDHDLDRFCLNSLDMNIMLWKKLAVNCVINPLTALHQCSNGELWKALETQQQGRNEHWDMLQWSFVHEIVSEVSHVALGVMTERMSQEEHPPSMATSKVESFLEQLQPKALLEFCHQVFHDTVNNQSSMWQDVQHGRPRTEIDYLNGYVVRKARDFVNIKTPANEQLVEAIHHRVESYNKSKV
jgi:2-dehydropantoate 2-reductase